MSPSIRLWELKNFDLSQALILAILQRFLIFRLSSLYFLFRMMKIFSSP